MRILLSGKKCLEMVFSGEIKNMEDFERFVRELLLELKHNKGGIYGEIWRKFTPKESKIEDAPLKETRKSCGRGLVARGRNP